MAHGVQRKCTTSSIWCSMRLVWMISSGISVSIISVPTALKVREQPTVRVRRTTYSSLRHVLLQLSKTSQASSRHGATSIMWTVLSSVTTAIQPCTLHRHSGWRRRSSCSSSLRVLLTTWFSLTIISVVPQLSSLVLLLAQCVRTSMVPYVLVQWATSAHGISSRETVSVRVMLLSRRRVMLMVVAPILWRLWTATW